MFGETPKDYAGVPDDQEGVSRTLTRLPQASGGRAVIHSPSQEFPGDAKCPAFACLTVGSELGKMSNFEPNSRLAGAGSTTPVILRTPPTTGHKRLKRRCKGAEPRIFARPIRLSCSPLPLAVPSTPTRPCTGIDVVARHGGRQSA